MRPSRHVIVFVREPRRGRVKSRLARDIGWGEAMRFYRTQCAALLRRLGGDRRWQVWLAVTPAVALASAAWPRRFPRLPQRRGDLGERMAAAFRALPPGPALLIGSDIPDIAPAHLAAAFAALGGKDAVFGPATDGGYWLIGLGWRLRKRLLLPGVRWSSAFALEDSERALGACRLVRVGTLTDIDDGEDLAAWRRAKSGR